MRLPDNILEDTYEKYRAIPYTLADKWDDWHDDITGFDKSAPVGAQLALTAPY